MKNPIGRLGSATHRPKRGRQRDHRRTGERKRQHEEPHHFQRHHIQHCRYFHHPVQDFPALDGLTAELTDRFTGKSTPISLKGVTDNAFAVTADSLSTGDRFEVVFRQAAPPVTVIPDTDCGDALKLYPNPVGEKLRVVVGVSFSGPYTAEVFNAAGVEVWKKSGISAGTKTVEVGTSALRSGVYALVLTDAKGDPRVEKFVRE